MHLIRIVAAVRKLYHAVGAVSLLADEKTVIQSVRQMNLMAAKAKEHEMGATTQIDQSRMMGTAAFKKEINHLLYSNSYTGSDGELDTGWNCRDHALVMALMLKSGDTYPKIANGKCMFVQGPVAGNAAFGIGQEDYHKSGHNWLVHAKFGLIDVSPSLQSKQHRFREPFNGIFNRVWLPPGKERTSVVLCHEPRRLCEADRKSPVTPWLIQPRCICTWMSRK